MSDREELARVLDPSRVEGRHIGTPHAGLVLHERQAEAIADAVVAAGWRKKPSREAVGAVVIEATEDWRERSVHIIRRDLTDAILALLDGLTETPAVTEGESE